jgi:hypothetical protein
MGFRKPRSDSKLMNLPDEQREELVSWLLRGMSYGKALVLLEKEPFYIETSVRALSEFYSEYCTSALLERRQRAATLSKSVRSEAETSPEDFDKSTIALLERWCFEMASAPSIDPKDVKNLMGLLLKRRDQDKKSESLAFEKEKFRSSLMKKIELGLEELHTQIKDNPAALAAFEALKGAIAK